MTGVIAATVVSLAGASALAHGGAAGAVMERMMGMSAMRDVMAEIAPAMQGTAPYNARAVQKNAARIMAHPGGNMTRLLKPVTTPPSTSSPSSGSGGTTSSGWRTSSAPTRKGWRRRRRTGWRHRPARLTVARLMGVEPRLDVVTAVAPTSSEGGIDFASMAADDVSGMVGQVCSACHAQVRSGR